MPLVGGAHERVGGAGARLRRGRRRPGSSDRRRQPRQPGVDARGARQREFGVRMAVGAGRLDLARTVGIEMGLVAAGASPWRSCSRRGRATWSCGWFRAAGERRRTTTARSPASASLEINGGVTASSPVLGVADDGRCEPAGDAAVARRRPGVDAQERRRSLVDPRTRRRRARAAGRAGRRVAWPDRLRRPGPQERERARSPSIQASMPIARSRFRSRRIWRSSVRAPDRCWSIACSPVSAPPRCRGDHGRPVHAVWLALRAAGLLDRGQSRNDAANLLADRLASRRPRSLRRAEDSGRARPRLHRPTIAAAGPRS